MSLERCLIAYIYLNIITYSHEYNRKICINKLTAFVNQQLGA